MATDKYNMRNPAVKRILQEVREMQNNASDDFMSLPVPDNIFEWQFAIRGSEDTEFQGGIYHGRIQLPPEYPFKPPAFMLLTPNGRFETQTKICLSISQHHPEHWQPSWSVRTALVALIAFMPTKADGALGSLSYTSEERSALALKSRSNPPKFGNSERQQLIDEIHEYMLKKVSPPKAQDPDADNPAPTTPDAQTPSAAEESGSPQDDPQAAEEREEREAETAEVGTNEPHLEAQEHPVVAPAGTREIASPVAGQESAQQVAAVNGGSFVSRLFSSEDLGLTLVAIGLTIAIIAILIKKLLAIPVQPAVMDS